MCMSVFESQRQRKIFLPHQLCRSCVSCGGGCAPAAGVSWWGWHQPSASLWSHGETPKGSTQLCPGLYVRGVCTHIQHTTGDTHATHSLFSGALHEHLVDWTFPCQRPQREIDKKQSSLCGPQSEAPIIKEKIISQFVKAATLMTTPVNLSIMIDDA